MISHISTKISYRRAAPPGVSSTPCKCIRFQNAPYPNREEQQALLATSLHRLEFLGRGIVLNLNTLLWYRSKKKEVGMASHSKKTESIRKRKKAAQARKRKKLASKMSTPAFAVHIDKSE